MTEGIPLKDIAGAVINLMNPHLDFEDGGDSDYRNRRHSVESAERCGFNSAVILQSQVRLTLDRGMLAQIICDLKYGRNTFNTCPDIAEEYLLLASKIISNLSSLIVVVKEKKG